MDDSEIREIPDVLNWPPSIPKYSPTPTEPEQVRTPVYAEPRIAPLTLPQAAFVDSIIETATAYPDDNPKTAVGLTKPSMANVPTTALLHLMRAMADGARKYGRMNWREKTVTASIYYDAAFRHMAAWYDGEEDATDSKVHHLGHAMACFAIILDAAAHGKLNDDRQGRAVFSEMVAKFTETK
ncbi:dATP/dGTP diphosphohydrolase domain-containing protein [Phyllobacterium endophyticum]|uniref:dATP/dGTP diphosphohydrolase domain-containing protein n=1 Tax=Phyllobacterium endophyticum TaxID=1149773 RepID=UPI0011C94ABA|nr:dATP/dGTP diphosphohydrolase domain-containing protein [Phyllobacterium endophyticum]TXR49902.1 hypothetical protein FVA77_07770 [Phyllobacterium endophyticum]